MQSATHSTSQASGGKFRFAPWRFLRGVGAFARRAPEPSPVSSVLAAPQPVVAAETSVKALWDSLSDAQKKEICFDWDHRDRKKGLLRTFIANHWQITRPCIRSDFYTKPQQWLIHDIFKGLINPEWYGRFLRQLRDDTFGHEWGADQSIAIFGRPGTGKFQFVLCGRHLTLRADGNTEGRVAFGGPILYAHAASGFTESAHHPGNVFWFQAQQASRVYHLLERSQRARAVVARRPDETSIALQGPTGRFPGLPLVDMDDGQRREVGKVLDALVEPFRKEDQQRVRACLERQGGLEQCSLAFYQEGNLRHRGLWDNWRLEGPAFVWYFRGTPHVHVWVNVADDPSVTVTAKNGVYIHPNHDPLGAWPKGSPPPEQP
jgi:hypothetical protein